MEHCKRLENLIRLLRAETADHPGIVEAVKAKAGTIAMPRWDTSLETRQAAEVFADELENWCAHHGHALDYYVQKPWLARWRTTCWRAMQKAQAEIDAWGSQLV